MLIICIVIRFLQLWTQVTLVAINMAFGQTYTKCAMLAYANNCAAHVLPLAPSILDEHVRADCQ